MTKQAQHTGKQVVRKTTNPQLKTSKQNPKNFITKYGSTIIAVSIGILILTYIICSRINTGTADNIISRYDGYLDTLDTLSKGCEKIPTSSEMKGLYEEVLNGNSDNINYNNINYDVCKDFVNYPNYFSEVKETTKEQALNKYFEEVGKSPLLNTVSTIQCLFDSCPAKKIANHFHLSRKDSNR